MFSSILLHSLDDYAKIFARVYDFQIIRIKVSLYRSPYGEKQEVCLLSDLIQIEICWLLYKLWDLQRHSHWSWPFSTTTESLERYSSWKLETTVVNYSWTVPNSFLEDTLPPLLRISWYLANESLFFTTSSWSMVGCVAMNSCLLIP